MASAASQEPNNQTTATLEQYEAAMRFFTQQKFERARPLLEKLLHAPIPAIADRAARHLVVCQQKLNSNGPAPKNADEYYTLGVVEMNQARYEQAAEWLQKAAKLNGNSAPIAYAQAALNALQNQVEPALEHLKAAIQLDPRMRWQARSDEDFNLLAEDPRFTEIIYPEK